MPREAGSRLDPRVIGRWLVSACGLAVLPTTLLRRGKTMSKFVVWHDLMTTDQEKSKRFYGELFNWRLWAWQRRRPLPPHLGGHQGHRRHDAARSQARRAFGTGVGLRLDRTTSTASSASSAQAAARYHMPAQDMDKVGRFAVVADPQGGVFSPFKATPGTIAGARRRCPPKPEPGEFCWDELLVGDPAAAVKFYESIPSAGRTTAWRCRVLAPTTSLKEGSRQYRRRDEDAAGCTGHGPLAHLRLGGRHQDASLERATKLGGRAPSPAR